MAHQGSKEHILKKTFYLLLLKGYDGVSITDIQAATRMSRGLLYHYYNNKEELFKEAVETFLTASLLIDPLQTKGYSIAQMITHTVKRYKNIYKELEEYPATPKITIANYDFLIYQILNKEESIAKTYAEMRSKERRAWTNATKISLDKKEIRNILNPDKIAGHFVALLDGVWMEAVEANDIEQHIRQTKQVLADYYQLLKV